MNGDIIEVQVVPWSFFGYRVRSKMEWSGQTVISGRGIADQHDGAVTIESGVYLRRRTAERRRDELLARYEIASR